jgi:Flp pilus assembly protein TadD
MKSSHPKYLLAQQLYEKKQFTQAVASFTLAIRDEENPQLYYERALAYLHNGDKQQCLNDLHTAASLEPENPFRFSSRAYVRDLMGDTAGAISDYEKCLELDAYDAVAHNNLGMLQEKLGWMEKAKKHFDTADTLAKDEFIAPEVTQAKGAAQEVPAAHVEENAGSVNRVVYDIFTKADTRKEFWTFIKNGFKLK